MRGILVLAAAPLALGGQSPKLTVALAVRPTAWQWKEPATFRAGGEDAIRVPLFQRKDRTPGAVVEVWGDASWARQDEFKAFVRVHLPAFRTAFDAGLSATVGGEHLANLMAGDPSARPPLIESKVWYNAIDPWARNPRFHR